MTNSRPCQSFNIRHSVISSTFGIRDCRGSHVGCTIRGLAGDTSATTGAFTLIELLVVIAIIIILAGLILTTAGYVQKKGARARAESEIAAMSAALESYKADNAIYPRDASTDNLDARTGLASATELNPNPTAIPSSYTAPSLSLYKVLSGDVAGNRQPSEKTYFSFPASMLWPRGSSNSVTALIDPFGNCYGYSTVNQIDPAKGFNPTFDLWSTGGAGTGATPTPSPAPTPINMWIKNW
jgi:type II secretory pathway pseudopilin PulG